MSRNSPIDQLSSNHVLIGLHGPQVSTSLHVHVKIWWDQNVLPRFSVWTWGLPLSFHTVTFYRQVGFRVPDGMFVGSLTGPHLNPTWHIGLNLSKTLICSVFVFVAVKYPLFRVCTLRFILCLGLFSFWLPIFVLVFAWQLPVLEVNLHIIIACQTFADIASFWASHVLFFGFDWQ